MKKNHPLHIHTLQNLEYSCYNLQKLQHETLSEKVWERPHSDIEAGMNNLISHLRKLLPSNPNVIIYTIKNIGYKLTC
ncbi:helix-turn-helix domain-containing protein [Proteiniphilum sp.]|uniref:helix-turn-helix domain-containing protein n=1 Tax=Proteiniphilum sp. TaxID=1926877 RepID=UPI003A598DAD